jgi:hypothetical protein
MALTGLWENWCSLAGEWVRSFVIVATTPNDVCVELHNRMPVVLAPDAWPGGGGGGGTAPAQGASRALPFRGDDLLAGESLRRQGQEQ